MRDAHLDDDALSAALDGLAIEAGRSHLADCDECRTRLEALRAVSVALAVPVVPPSPEAVSAAVRAALDAGLGAGPTPARPPIDLAGRRLPAAAAAGRRGGRRHPNRVPGRVSGRRAHPGRTRWLGAAAIVLTVLVGAGASLRWFRGGPTARTDSVTAAEGAGAGNRAAAAATGGATPAAVAGGAGSALAGPDLGDQTDPAAVARLVKAALGRDLGPSASAGLAVPAGEAPSAGGAGATAVPTAGSASGGPASSVASPAGEVAGAAVPGASPTGPTGGVLPAASGGAVPGGAVPGGAVPGGAVPGCGADAVAFGQLAGEPAVLRYVAELRYRGVAATVWVYARAGGLTAVIMRQSDCAGLARLPTV